jgi:hypothetical protein
MMHDAEKGVLEESPTWDLQPAAKSERKTDESEKNDLEKLRSTKGQVPPHLRASCMPVAVI